MINVRVKLEHKRLDEAFRKAPRVMLKHLRKNLGRAGSEVAREARKNAPKFLTTLTSSIRSRLSAGPSSISAIIETGTNYARIVEEGGGSGGRVPLSGILQWIRTKRIVPFTPDTTDRQLAFLIQRSILAKGTRAQPYMQPALDKKRGRVEELINKGVTDGIREVFG